MRTVAHRLYQLLHAQSRIEARIVALEWIAMVLVGIGAALPSPLGPNLPPQSVALVIIVLALHPFAYTAIACVGYPWLNRDAPARMAVLTAIDITIAVGVLFLTATNPGYTQVLLFCVVLLAATRYSRGRAIGITALVSVLQFFSIIASVHNSIPVTSLGGAVLAMFALTYGVNLLSDSERKEAAIALENAGLYHAVLLRNRELATINALGETATQDTNPDRLLESGLELILSSMPVSWGQGYRYDRKHGSLELLFVRSADLTGDRTGAGDVELEARQAAQGRTVVAISFFGENGEQLTRVSAPIVVQNGTVGVLQAVVPMAHSDSSGNPPMQSLAVVCQELGTWIDRATLRDAAQRGLVLEEKNRIARELHDTVLQILFTLGLNVDWCTSRVADDSALRAKLGDMRKLTASASGELRSAIFTLSSTVADVGLVQALEKLTAEFSEDNQLPISLSTSGIQPNLALLAQNALHRVVREGIMNAYKHAKASHVSVRLVFETGSVTVVVQDDGVGLSPSVLQNYTEDPGHFGLRTVAKQIEELDGTFEIMNGDESGAVVRATIPLRRATDGGHP